MPWPTECVLAGAALAAAALHALGCCAGACSNAPARFRAAESCSCCGPCRTCACCACCACCVVQTRLSCEFFAAKCTGQRWRRRWESGGQGSAGPLTCVRVNMCTCTCTRLHARGMASWRRLPCVTLCCVALGAALRRPRRQQGHAAKCRGVDERWWLSVVALRGSTLCSWRIVPLSIGLRCVALRCRAAADCLRATVHCATHTSHNTQRPCASEFTPEMTCVSIRARGELVRAAGSRGLGQHSRFPSACFPARPRDMDKADNSRCFLS